VPGYEVLDVLGRGAMGVVYRARHLALKRIVALKMIRAGAHADLGERARFRTEAEAVARLQHPNIVQVFDVGEHDGLPYLALEFVEGGALDRRLAGKPQPPREAARLVETLAGAVHLAHSRNVVHRDLKPGNVLLTADGTPKVTDFGLAKHLDADAGQTQAGHVLGTPSYMAPEQTGGNSKEVGPAADVYALGAILYECLTGRPPFQGATVLDILEQVRSREPVPPRQLSPRVSHDLETICLKCLRKEPERRYPSARELADDLGRFRRGEAVLAQPPTLRYLLGKQLGRYRVPLAVAAAVLLAAVVGVVVAFVQIKAAKDEAFSALDREKEARGDAETKEKETNDALTRLREADAKRKVLLSEAARMYCEWSERELKQGNERDSLNWMLRAYETAPEDDPWRHGYRLLIAAKGQTLERRYLHGKAVRAVAYSPDGRTALTGSADKTARLWDIASGKEIAILRHDGEVRAVAYSPDGRTVLTGSADKTARLWDAASGKELHTLRHDSDVRAVAFSPDGRTTLTGGKWGTVRVWDIASDKELRALRHDGEVRAVAYSPDGRTVLTGSADKTARLWDAASGKELHALRHRGEVNAVAISPDGRTVLTGDEHEAARLWDAASGKEIATLPHDDPVNAVAFSPDGRTALTGSGSVLGRARLWDAASGKPITSLQPYGDPVHAVAFSPDGSTALTGNGGGFNEEKGEARLWDTASGKEHLALRHHGLLWAVAFSADGRIALTGSQDKTARLWDAASGKELHTLRHDGDVRAVAFSPDGRTALTGSADLINHQGEARLWEAASGKELHALRHRGEVNAVAYSPDGRTVLTGSADKTARLWDAASGKELHTLRHRGVVNAVAISPDGRTVLTGSADKTARLWDAASSKELHALRHDGEVRVVAYSLDGRTALTSDGTARLWDAASGKEIASLPQPEIVFAVAYCPDGRTALAGCFENTGWLWALPLPTPDEPARVRAWVRVRTARWFSEQGPLRDLTHAEWREQCRQLEALGGDWQRPTDPRLWHLAQAASAEGAVKWYAAAFHLRRLLIGEPGNAWYLERLGTALYRDGRFAEAVERLSDAVQRHGQGGTPATQLVLAMAHHRLGQRLAGPMAVGLFADPQQSPLAVATAQFSHDALARRWLAQAVKQIDAMKKPDSPEMKRLRDLRAEAEALLKPSKP
jgi:WD40 repeat protein/tRNA A-37 threonylcarbamoyl transferase component Bud32